MNNVINLHDFKNKNKPNQKNNSELTFDERLQRISSMVKRINDTLKELENSLNRNKK